MNRFANCFADADKIVLAPIYAARDPENEIKAVSSSALAEAISASGQAVQVAESLDEVVNVAASQVNLAQAKATEERTRAEALEALGGD